MGDIAIIGLSVRFPGADSIEKFWDNLINGKESITFFEPTELCSDMGVDPVILSDPNFIPAKGYLEKAEFFAADFFNFTTKNAFLTDPQFRLLLECVWEAWENAGYNPFEYPGLVGVYTSSSSHDNYFEKNILHSADFNYHEHGYNAFIRNAKDFLATQIAYQFNFQGPCINIQTACSSSLVTVYQACNDLLENKCQVAIAGGVSITFPLKQGYLYKEGMILSKDGHCRPFSEVATGTVIGNGGGIVILKTLKNALQDRDNIYAIIKGSAINNDGSDKLSFAAPSIKGQYEVLVMAARSANIDPGSIGYIEAHGTGTNLGDQIEIAAIKQYLSTSKTQFPRCLVGSVKSNIGHLDVASGIAGLIKTVLALKNKTIPKTLHCEYPNPALELVDNFLYVAQKTQHWQQQDNTPRRAGVSSFGVGGTNAHVILEEAPNTRINLLRGVDKNKTYILPLSAKSIGELEAIKDNLVTFLNEENEFNFADIAYTLTIGRKNFPFRWCAICDSKENAINALYFMGSENTFSNKQDELEPKSVFLFPDIPMRDYLSTIKLLYENIIEFRVHLDICFDAIKNQTGLEFKGILLQTEICKFNDYYRTIIQPLGLFVFEYCLAKTWQGWGINPQMLIGFGAGEYVAACIANIFSIEDGIKLLLLHTKVLQTGRQKIMMSILTSVNDLTILIKDKPIEINAILTKTRCLVSVDASYGKKFQQKLERSKIDYEILDECPTIYFDSSVNIKQVSDTIKLVKFSAPQIPIKINFINNLRNNECSPIATFFYENLISTLRERHDLYVEISPIAQLGPITQQNNYQSVKNKIKIIQSLSLFKNNFNIFSQINTTLAQLWVAGQNINWLSIKYLNLVDRKRVPLPTYPLVRQPYLIRPNIKATNVFLPAVQKNDQVIKWIYIPKWTKRPGFKISEALPEALIFTKDPMGIGKAMVTHLQKQKRNLSFISMPIASYKNDVHDVDELWLQERMQVWQYSIDKLKTKSEIIILHSATLTLANESNIANGFFDLLALGKVLGKNNQRIKLFVISNGVVKISTEDNLCLINSTVLGPVHCLPFEYNTIESRCIDVRLEDNRHDLIEGLCRELKIIDKKKIIALRSKQRFARNFLSYKDASEQSVSKSVKFRIQGTYLITGGLGGVGLVFAEYLVRNYCAKIILISRSKLPDQDTWSKVIADTKTPKMLIRKLETLSKIFSITDKVLIFSADISDSTKMSSIIDQSKKYFGEINGVIHAATTLPEGLIWNKNISIIEETFKAKIYGLEVLGRLIDRKNLDFILMCSASNTITGAAGAVDYVAANSYLDAYALKNTSSDCPIISLAWPAWNETGVLFEYIQRNLVKIKTSVTIKNSIWELFIKEHKFDNTMLIPGTLMLELSQHVYSKLSGFPPKTIEKFSFMRPGFVDDINNLKIRAIFDKVENIVNLESHINGSWVSLSQGQLSSTSESVCLFDLKSQLTEFENIPCINSPYLKYKNDKTISTGDHWSCLKWVKQNSHYYLAEIVLSDKYKLELADFILHPSLIDVAISYHTEFYEGQYLPYYIKKLTIHSPLPIRFYSLIQVITDVNREANNLVCNIELVSVEGEKLITVEGFTLKQVNINILKSKPICEIIL